MATATKKAPKAVDPTIKTSPVKFPENVHVQLRKLAYVDYDCSISTLVVEAVTNWLKDGKKVSKAFAAGQRPAASTQVEELEDEEEETEE